MDRETDRKLLLFSDSWKTDGDVRRAQRLMLREWAVSGRSNYGLNSIKSYCYYIANHKDRIGGLG